MTSNVVKFERPGETVRRLTKKVAAPIMRDRLNALMLRPSETVETAAGHEFQQITGKGLIVSVGRQAGCIFFRIDDQTVGGKVMSGHLSPDWHVSSWKRGDWEKSLFEI